MNHKPISIIAIATSQTTSRIPDMNTILAALGSHVDSWNWCVRGVDAVGPTAADFCRRVELAGDKGLWLSSEQLLAETAGIAQTIEGEFLAFPITVDPRTLHQNERSWINFPASPAELAIVAVDGTTFDILTKDGRLLSNLRKQWQVTDQPITSYFPALVHAS